MVRSMFSLVSFLSIFCGLPLALASEAQAGATAMSCTLRDPSALREMYAWSPVTIHVLHSQSGEITGGIQRGSTEQSPTQIGFHSSNGVVHLDRLPDGKYKYYFNLIRQRDIEHCGNEFDGFWDEFTATTHATSTYAFALILDPNHPQVAQVTYREVQDYGGGLSIFNPGNRAHVVGNQIEAAVTCEVTWN